jgi:hypothetical protein
MTSGAAVTADFERLLVVGDAHLTAGPAAEDVQPASRALARFLEAVPRDSRATTRLLVLGDLLDFVRVDGPAGGVSAGLSKLDRIVDTNADVFAALGRSAAAGMAIDVVPGNHDVELTAPELQARFREHATRLSGVADAGAAIRFHPWIVYLPGVLYAEHGQQYHDLNAFLTILSPPRGDDRFELPLGSRIELALADVSRSIDPRATGVPSLRRLIAALRAHPRRALFAAPRLARLMWIAVTGVRSLSSASRLTARRAYRAQSLAAHAADVGLAADVLARIDELSETALLRARRRLARAAWLAVWPRRRRGAQPGDYLTLAARSIDRLLADAGAAVPYYLFGHSHVAADWEVLPAGPGPRYLNAGAWAESRPDCYPLVELSREAGAVRARLRCWNDAARRIEDGATVGPPSSPR